MVLVDDLFGYFDYYCVWWDGFDYDGIGVDLVVFVDFDWIEDFGFGVDDYVVIDGGMVFFVNYVIVVESDVVIDCDVVVDFCGFFDYYVGCVVDEYVSIDDGIGVDIYIG